MDDVISRQRTIDVIKEFKHGAEEWRDEQEERSDIWHRADSAIASALEIGLRVKKIPSAQQWIPCSERLPEIGQTVITSSDLGRVREATYKGFDAWTIHGVVHWTDEILSWMPLPEPYKEDE